MFRYMSSVHKFISTHKLLYEEFIKLILVTAFCTDFCILCRLKVGILLSYGKCWSVGLQSLKISISVTVGSAYLVKKGVPCVFS